MTILSIGQFSPIQKNLIRAATKQIGSHPCRFEKITDNGLKIFIQEIAAPIEIDASTSEKEAIKQLTSQINNLIPAENEASERNKMTPNNLEKQLNKMVSGLVNHYRSIINELQIKEQKRVEAEQSVDGIMPARKKMIEDAINDGLAKRNKPKYVTRSMIRCMNQELARHLDYMLPTPEAYQAMINTASNPKPAHHSAELVDASLLCETESHPQHTQQQETNLPTTRFGFTQTECVKPKHKPAKADTVTVTKKVKVKTTITHTKTKALEGDLVDPVIDAVTADWMTLSSAQRIELFKTISHQEAQLIMADLQQAMSERYEEDIQEVMAQILDKGLDLQDLMARMQ